MSTSDPDGLEYTRRLEVAPQAAAGYGPAGYDPAAQEPYTAPPLPPTYAPSAPEPVYAPEPPALAPAARGDYAEAYGPPPGEAQETVLYVPLAVTVGDGFKFGCGFFMAAVMAMLVGFVLVAALFLVSSLAGVSLPVGR